MEKTLPRLPRAPGSGPNMILLRRLLRRAGERPVSPSCPGPNPPDDLVPDLPAAARRRTLVIGETVDEPAAPRGFGRAPCALNDNPRGQAEVG